MCFSLAEVIAATGAVADGKQNTEESRFAGISTDSRTLKRGDLFIALKGENFDGHEYVEQVIAQGAGAVIVNRDYYAMNRSDALYILVDDTLKALLDLAACHRRRYQYPVIAVTGSNGKTTTKEMLASVLGSKFRVHKSKANHNNEIGVAQTLLAMSDEYDVAIVEMGMRGLGEIALLTEIAQPTAGIITNIADTHIERLKSVENIAQAKGELAVGLAENTCLYVNGDDGWEKFLRDRTKADVSTFGFDAHCDTKVLAVEKTDMYSSDIRVDCNGNVFALHIPVSGRHNMYNALAVVATAVQQGLSQNEIIAGMKTFVNADMRFSITKTGSGITLINDAYNASPLSMQAGLETLCSTASGRKVAVLGDMLELGEHAEEAHSKIIRFAAACGIDALFVLGKEMSKAVEKEKSSLGVQSFVMPSHEKIAEKLASYLLEDDFVLLKGSRGMGMEKVVSFCNKLR